MFCRVFQKEAQRMNVSIDVLDTPDVPRYLRTMYSHGNNNWINPNNNYYAKLRNL